MHTRPDEDRELLSGEPEGPDSTWEEIGFAEYPIVTTSLKRPPFDTLEFVEEVGSDEKGNPINRTWKMVGSAEYGLPRLPDLDVFMAVLKLLDLGGYRQRLVTCTLKDICDISGIGKGGATYQRVKDAFTRFATTTYVAERVFRDPKTKVLIPLETWEIITESRFTENNAVLPSYFEAGKRFLSRLANGQPKPVDLSFWRELPLGLEKPIYHYLDKNLHGGKDRHQVGLKKLCERIALTGKYSPAHLQRLLSRPLQNLVHLSFLSEFTFEPSKSRTDPVKLVVFPGPRARGERRTSHKVSSYQPEPNHAAKGQISRNSAPTESDSDIEARLVRRFHERMHGTAPTEIHAGERSKARALRDLQGSDELALYTVDFACDRMKESNWHDVQHFGSVLSNDYAARARSVREAESKKLERMKLDAEQRRLETEYHAWHQAESDRRWNGLSPADQEARVLEARAELVAKHDVRGWVPGTVEKTAQGRARNRLCKDLPSFPEWVRQRQKPLH